MGFDLTHKPKCLRKKIKSIKNCVEIGNLFSRMTMQS